MAFPLSYTVSAETAGPPSDPTATGGLAAAIATALRVEELDFSQPDPVTFRVGKRLDTDWARANTDPWAYVSGAKLRIEPIASGLRVHLTASFIRTLLISAVLAAAAMGFRLFIAAAVPLVSFTLIYVLGRDRMEQWLRDVTRRSDAARETD